MKGDEIILKNEFAHVLIKKDTSANGVRLMIQDIRTGKIGYLDPLELECLAWSSHQDLKPLLDPSLSRWKTDARVAEESDGFADSGEKKNNSEIEKGVRCDAC